MTNETDGHAGSAVATGPSFLGKTALILGGTGGIGLRSAQILFAGGASVVVNGRTTAGGDAALKTLGAAPGRAFFQAGDCSDYAGVQEIMSRTVEQTGGFDILISAGPEGRVRPKPFSEMRSGEIEDAFRSRVFPRMFAMHAALPILRDRNQGAVVMLTTDAARHVTPGEGMIGAAGAALILATKALAKEFAPWGIRVNTVAMTLTSGTPSWDRIFSKDNFERDLFAKALSGRASSRSRGGGQCGRVPCLRYGKPSNRADDQRQWRPLIWRLVILLS